MVYKIKRVKGNQKGPMSKMINYFILIQICMYVFLFTPILLLL